MHAAIELKYNSLLLPSLSHSGKTPLLYKELRYPKDCEKLESKAIEYTVNHSRPVYYSFSERAKVAKIGTVEITPTKSSITE